VVSVKFISSNMLMVNITGLSCYGCSVGSWKIHVFKRQSQHFWFFKFIFYIGRYKNAFLFILILSLSVGTSARAIERQSGMGLSRKLTYVLIYYQNTEVYEQAKW